MLHRYMRTDRQTGGLKRVNCLIMFEYTSYLTENTVRLQSKNARNENNVYLLWHSKPAERPA